MNPRNCYRLNNFFTQMVCDQHFISDEMNALLRNPDNYLRRHPSRIVQNNFKNRIVFLEIGATKAIVKIHNYKSTWHRIKRYFRRTRASTSWHYSLLFNENGIPTPRPIAYKETRIGPLRGDSYFIYEWVDGITGDEYFLRNANNAERIQKAVESIVDIISKIKNLGLIHGDIRLKNIIFKGDEIFLTDFDDIGKRRWYKPGFVNNRDFRGLIKDIHYNVPQAIQPFFLSRLALLGNDIKRLVKSYRHKA